MKKKAFTLVELLVVISVIALMLAVLMPALSKARQIGKRLTCANNLKQLAVGMTMYVMSYKYYPVCVDDVNISWQEFIENKNNIDNNEMLGVAAALWPFHKTKKLYDCPELITKKYAVSYCYNWFNGRVMPKGQDLPTITTAYIPPVEPEAEQRKILLNAPEKIRHTASFIQLYDLSIMPDKYAVRDYYADIDPDDAVSSLSKADEQGQLWHYRDDDATAPHGGGHNIQFADGHIKFFGNQPDNWPNEHISRNPFK